MGASVSSVPSTKSQSVLGSGKGLSVGGDAAPGLGERSSEAGGLSAGWPAAGEPLGRGEVEGGSGAGAGL